MEVKDALHVFENYPLWLFIIGVGFLCATVLPRLLSKQPFAFPILLLIVGYLAIALPFGLEASDPRENGVFAEHLTEIGVIISLMGAGLNIDRPFSFKAWKVTWRLLAITMVITIALTTLVGWAIAAFVPATAVLLGAVIAPTDPVLASEVQVTPPQKSTGSKDETALNNESEHEAEEEIRFALTSEAGLNDGLAFPFTNMAIAMALAGAHPANWIDSWLLINVLMELGLGIILGLGMGWLVAQLLFAQPAKNDLAKAMVGLTAVAGTFIIYGVTEFLGGYGFIAVFIGAVVIRSSCRAHEYHLDLYKNIEKTERILMVAILIALGAAIAGGLLDALTWPLVLCALLIVFIIRPLAGVLGLIGFKKSPWRDRLAISFLGIRGIGSLYYLAYALNMQDFKGEDEIWALVALVIVISIFVHGITATPITSKLDKMREQKGQTS